MEKEYENTSYHLKRSIFNWYIRILSYIVRIRRLKLYFSLSDFQKEKILLLLVSMVHYNFAQAENPRSNDELNKRLNRTTPARCSTNRNV